MNNEERYERGARLLDDARFVRAVLMDAAVRAKKWNIVVFEAYRAAELLVKGIIYSMGYEPRQHHRLHTLVARLSAILEKHENRLPFLCKATDRNGNCYQIRIAGKTMRLFKQIAGTYTQLGSTTHLSNPYLPPKLVRNGSSIAVHQGSKRILSTVDSALTDGIRYEREFLRAPDRERVDRLKSLVAVLLLNREVAFYSERLFLEEHGVTAISTLAEVFELAEAFEIYDRA